jgi:hypothetical protein
MTFYFTDLNRGYQNDTDEATAFVALGVTYGDIGISFWMLFQYFNPGSGVGYGFFSLTR